MHSRECYWQRVHIGHETKCPKLVLAVVYIPGGSATASIAFLVAMGGPSDPHRARSHEQKAGRGCGLRIYPYPSNLNALETRDVGFRYIL